MTTKDDEEFREVDERDGLTVEEGDINQVLPPGIYEATATQAWVKRTQSVTLRLRFEVHDGEEPWISAFDHFVLKNSQGGERFPRQRLGQLYQACGEALLAGERIQFKLILNKRLRVRIEHQEFQGQTRMRIKNYLPLLADAAENGAYVPAPDELSMSKDTPF